MTPTKATHDEVVVVDGSNIATEGRSTPSLTQLNDAVMAYRDEHPDAVVTVVVDATFGHRIPKQEVPEFDAAVAHNELVAPPAGAIGRGDAFVLSIANKVGARVLSNDSFQEFHGEYPWLFDEGRLIGGKPVPHIGWVFVERLPVKGPVSRKAQRAARDAKPVRRSASKEASQPMPVPTAPPPAAARRLPAAPATAAVTTPPSDDAAHRSTAGTAVNELLPFLDFVEHHPIGSSVNGVVESYSSHGAYVTINGLRGYVPLRLMASPPPRSAREVMRVGDAVTLVVTSFAAARRSVDLAVPALAPVAEVVPTPELEELAEAVVPAKKAAAKKTAAKKGAPEPAKKIATRKKATTKKAAAKEAELAKDVEPAKGAAKKAPGKTAAAKRSPTKKTAAKSSATKNATAVAKAPAKRSARKRPATEAEPVSVAASGGSS